MSRNEIFDKIKEVFDDFFDGDVEISNELPATINQAWFDSLGLTKVTVLYE